MQIAGFWRFSLLEKSFSYLIFRSTRQAIMGNSFLEEFRQSTFYAVKLVVVPLLAAFSVLFNCKGNR